MRLSFATLAVVALIGAAACDTRVSIAPDQRTCAVDADCALTLDGDVCDVCRPTDRAIAVASLDTYNASITAKQRACFNIQIARACSISADCAPGPFFDAICEHGSCTAVPQEDASTDAGPI